jgi:hypothetical protein
MYKSRALQWAGWLSHGPVTAAAAGCCCCCWLLPFTMPSSTAPSLRRQCRALQHHGQPQSLAVWQDWHRECKARTIHKAAVSAAGCRRPEQQQGPEAATGRRRRTCERKLCQADCSEDRQPQHARPHWHLDAAWDVIAHHCRDGVKGRHTTLNSNINKIP